MATTTSQQQHHRYQDYTGLAEISQPHPNNNNSSNGSNNHNNPAVTAPLRGARRDYMAQANKHSSRQTMTTVGSSSRGLSADSSGVDRRIRMLDGSNSNNNNNMRCTHEDRERQRRAEENAAFVKMLEEESFMLQGGRMPKQQLQDRTRSTSSGDGYDRYRDGGRSYGRSNMNHVNNNNKTNSYSSSRSGGSRPGQRYSQRQQQSPQQQYHPHHLYSPYHHQHQQEEEDQHQEREHERMNSHHDRDIPLELSIPTSSARNTQQQQDQQQEYSLNMNVDDMRKGNPGEDRRHPDQLHLFKRQSKSRSLSPGHQHSSPINTNNRRHTMNSREEEFEPPPNLMSLEEAILNLEMEEKGQLPPQHHSPLPPRREMPHDYDAILTGGANDHRRHHHSPHRHVDSHRRGGGGDDKRHYHPSPQEIVAHNNHYGSSPHQQQQPQHNHNPHHHGGHGHGGGHPRPPHPHAHEQPPVPPRTPYDQPPSRLQAPVECIEFPVDWDGREIEPTEDDELLDRDEDEFYRRRAAHRLREQQQQQQSLQSLQSQSHQSMSQSRAAGSHPSRQQQQQQQTPSSRSNNHNGPVRRAQSTVSNDSFGLGGAADLYSQNVALSGRRAPMQMIEVSPGVSMPFRGSEETWEAIALNRIVRTECLGCSIQLYCVEDAELVVCPDCQTMSPAHKTEDPKAKRTGLGLGFKEEQLVQWRNAGP